MRASPSAASASRWKLAVSGSKAMYPRVLFIAGRAPEGREGITDEGAAVDDDLFE